MTKRTVVLTFCDLPHAAEVEASTISLVLDRETTEVDLCAEHQAEILGPLVAVGRTIRKPGRKPRTA